MSKDYEIKISVAGTGEAGSQGGADSSAPAPLPLQQLTAAELGGTGSAPAPMDLGQMAAGGPDAAPEPMTLEELGEPDGS
ncbi:hypothetical protein [Glutamicibacter sp.]|uniref:hypothetical protein n=1 Tax=Glutamicibacter sp. TaxID=1931995 RepID=UPI0028BD9D53|nr:hypothetical protein [Glutamicibacter sp.]